MPRVHEIVWESAMEDFDEEHQAGADPAEEFDDSEFTGRISDCEPQS